MGRDADGLFFLPRNMSFVSLLSLFGEGVAPDLFLFVNLIAGERLKHGQGSFFCHVLSVFCP